MPDQAELLAAARWLADEAATVTGAAVEFLTATWAHAEETAKAAGRYGEVWTEGGDGVYLKDTNCGVVIGPYGCGLDADIQGHIVLNDPSGALRRIAAERALLADLQAERHLVIDGDCWFTCPAATEDRDGGENCDDARRGRPCNCGRDARVGRRIRLLAQAWGWAEEGS